MSIRMLKTLIAISETGSFSMAAEKICISQAAVSQQMKRLEELLQVHLFDRSGRTPTLTPTAKTLVPKARDVLQRYDQLLSSATNETNLSGELTIGAVPSSMTSLVPLSLKSLYQSYPGIHIRVVPNLSSDLLPQVDRGAVDAAIMSEPPQTRPHFTWQPIASEELMVVCAHDVTIDDPASLLTSHPYIRMARRAWISTQADDILDEYGLHLQDSMELESLETIASMVSHNLGVAIIPKPCVPNTFSENLNFVTVGNPPRARTLGILSREDNEKHLLIKQLHFALRQTVLVAETAS